MDFELIMRIYAIGILTVGFGTFIFFEIILPLVSESKKKEEFKEKILRVCTTPAETITLTSSLKVPNYRISPADAPYIKKQLANGLLNTDELINAMQIERMDDPIDNDVYIYKAKLIVVKYPEDSKYEQIQV